jgi:radical SAM-linked protein
VAFHGALPVGVESLCETLDLALADQVGSGEVVSHLNRVLPVGLKVLQAHRLPRPPKPPRVEQMVFQVVSPDAVFAADAAAGFLERQEFPVIRRRPKGERTVDLRRLVAALEIQDARNLRLCVNQAEKANLKATEIISNIFRLTESQTQDLHIVKLQVI